MPESPIRQSGSPFLTHSQVARVLTVAASTLGGRIQLLRGPGQRLVWRLRLTHPQITQIWADSAYARDLLPAWTADHLWLSLRPVLRPKGTRGFVVLPRRWKVERSLGWIMNARRNARDYERLPQHSEAHLNWAFITLMARRLTRKSPTASWAKKLD